MLKKKKYSQEAIVLTWGIRSRVHGANDSIMSQIVNDTIIGNKKIQKKNIKVNMFFNQITLSQFLFEFIYLRWGPNKPETKWQGSKDQTSKWNTWKVIKQTAAKSGCVFFFSQLTFWAVTFPPLPPSFFENMSRIIAPKYVPTETDVLRVRVRTCGIVETQFQLNEIIFR